MRLLKRLLGHDVWTTRQLLDIAAQLTDDQLDREWDIGHRSVRRTFEHLLWNVECWTDLMRSVPVRTCPAAGQSMQTLLWRHELAAQALSDFATQLALADRLDETYVDTLDRPPTEKSFGGTILHIATHNMHHRAQLLYLFRLLGVRDLPEGDVLSWEASVEGPI